jgi:hypothetical protein
VQIRTSLQSNPQSAAKTSTDQLAQLHTELLLLFEILFCACDCQNVRMNINKPAMCFDIPNWLSESFATWVYLSAAHAQLYLYDATTANNWRSATGQLLR